MTSLPVGGFGGQPIMGGGQQNIKYPTANPQPMTQPKPPMGIAGGGTGMPPRPMTQPPMGGFNRFGGFGGQPMQGGQQQGLQQVDPQRQAFAQQFHQMSPEAQYAFQNASPEGQNQQIQQYMQQQGQPPMGQPPIDMQRIQQMMSTVPQLAGQLGGQPLGGMPQQAPMQNQPMSQMQQPVDLMQQRMASMPQAPTTQQMGQENPRMAAMRNMQRMRFGNR